MTLSIRTAQAQDALAIARLLGQLGYPQQVSATRRALQRLRAQPGCWVWVAQRDGVLLGLMQLAEVAGLAEADYLEIRSLVVDAGARSQGIGAQLLARAQQWAQQQGIARVRVRCNRQREAAQRFYRSHRFVAVKVQTVFERPLPTAPETTPAG